jgi:hypothetical protein
MRPRLLVAIPWIVLMPSVLAASDIYFNYDVSADAGPLCHVGDVVHWKLAATVVGPTRGIQCFSVKLVESRGEGVITMPWGRVPTWIYPGVYVVNWYDNAKVYGFFTHKNYFEVGGANGAWGVPLPLSAKQFVSPMDGQDLQALFDSGGAAIDVAADLRDFTAFAARWRSTGANRANLWHHGCDTNRSGVVDIQDLTYFATRYLQPTDPNSL